MIKLIDHTDEVGTSGLQASMVRSIIPDATRIYPDSTKIIRKTSKNGFLINILIDTNDFTIIFPHD